MICSKKLNIVIVNNCLCENKLFVQRGAAPWGGPASPPAPRPTPSAPPSAGASVGAAMWASSPAGGKHFVLKIFILFLDFII